MHPASSDADFLVEFAPEAPPSLKSFFEVKADLEQLLGRGVDLIEPGAVRNPYVLASINRNREAVYAACTTRPTATRSKFGRQSANGEVHHCCSHGTPSLLPSISMPWQFFRKSLASLHDVICEQCFRPSQVKRLDVGCAG